MATPFHIVRGALPHEWMKTAWDRWAETRKLGDSLEGRQTGFDIKPIKTEKVIVWMGIGCLPGVGAAWAPF